MEIGQHHSQACFFLQRASCYQHTSLRVGVWGCGGVGVWVCGRVGVWVCGGVWVWVWSGLTFLPQEPGKRSLKENRGSLTPTCCSGGDGV